MKPDLIPNYPKKIAIFCAWFVLLIGPFVYICWQIGLMAFKPPYFLHRPFPYFSSICLILSGLSLLNLIYTTRIPLYRLFSALLFAVSGFQLLQLFLPVDLRIHVFFSKMLVQKFPESTFHFLIEAANFLLISLGLFFLPCQKRGEVYQNNTKDRKFDKEVNPTQSNSNSEGYLRVKCAFSICCFFLVFFVAVETAIVHLAPLFNNYLNEYFSSYFFTAGSQIILAIGVLLWVNYLNLIQTRIPNWLPLAVIITLLSFHLFLIYIVFHTKQTAIPVETLEKISIREIINQWGTLFLIILSMTGTIASILSGILVYVIKKLILDPLFLLKREKKFFQISQEVIKMMEETATIPEAAEKMLQILHEAHDWQLLLYWAWNKEKKVLELFRYQSLAGYFFPHFEEASRQLIITKETFISQVFENKCPILFKDFSQKAILWASTLEGDIKKRMSDQTLDRISAAKEDGIKGALVLPVYERQQLVGLLELFRIEPFPVKVDDQWLEFMRGIGVQFSVFIERIQAENDRKDLAGFIESSIDAVYTIDEKLDIIQWNKFAEIMFGWKKEEIIGHNIVELFPADRIEEYETLKQVYKEKKYGFKLFETQRVRKDKTLLWIERFIFFASRGELIIVARDITQQKKTLSDLKKSEEKLRLIVETNYAWIWEMDLSGKYTHNNINAEKITGFSLDALTAKKMTELAADSQMMKGIKASIEDKKGWKNVLWKIRRKDGSIIWLESTGNPVWDENKNVIGFSGAERDVTEQITIQKAKDEFISMISHELRTPLTSILGSLGILKEKASEETKEYLELAYRNAERLKQLINDILDIEKIQMKTLKLETNPLSVATLIHDAIATAQVNALANQITIIEGNLFPTLQILGDYDRLLQVLLNLLSNAVKFSFRGGKVEVRMEVRGKYIRVLVEDWGQGIPVNMQSKIFEKFFQVEMSDIREKGTGLNLNISKSIIEEMGGTIDFVSKPNEGTTFFFDFPILQAG